MIKNLILTSIINNTNITENNLINKKLLSKLINCKNKIDSKEINLKWDNAKKLSNSFELIYLPNKKNRINSIALYQPLSRSYFKLWELIYDFDLLKENYQLNILCLAEGPGGFIEAIVNFRDKKKIKDNIYGISLKSKDKDIPGWKKSQNFLKNNKNVTITYGYDDTGDLYNVKNIEYLKKIIVDKSEFITADGGFDFSINFNKQEELSYKIIFCEVVAALHNQKINGCFICKIFDINTIITMKIIYLLTCYYEVVYITKPLTSRPANSEKYIICKRFKGIPNYKLKMFNNFIKKWETIPNNKILSFIQLPKIFVNKIKNFNEILIKNQINHIYSTIELIEIKNKEKISQILSNQIIKAKEWCNKYKIEINIFSKYIN